MSLVGRQHRSHVNVRGMQNSIRRIIDLMPEDLARLRNYVAEGILRDAKKPGVVPVDTGALRDSGRTSKGAVIFGNDEVRYASIVALDPNMQPISGIKDYLKKPTYDRKARAKDIKDFYRQHSLIFTKKKI